MNEFFSINALSLLNIIAAIMILLQFVIGALLTKTIYSIRIWIPNKLAVLIDVYNLCLQYFAIFFGLFISIYSILSGATYYCSSFVLLISFVVVTFHIFGFMTGQNIPKPPCFQNEARFIKKSDADFSIIAGGDVSFDRTFEPPLILRRESFFCNLPVTFSWLSRKPELPIPCLVSTNEGKENECSKALYQNALPLKPSALNGDLNEDPFGKIKNVLKAADLAFINLESPLTHKKRKEPYRLASHPGYAKLLKEAGIDVVNLANNHCFDGGEEGLYETTQVLENEQIAFTGVGTNLKHARLGVVSNVKGFKIAWLGYTQKMGRVSLEYAVATDKRLGCLPLDPNLIYEDIRNARERADYVIVTPHWGVEGYHTVSSSIRKLAKSIIDAGANAVFGQGPHLYQGIEIYKGCPIVYSLGTFIFGFWFFNWGNNILAKLNFKSGILYNLEIIPLAGRKDALYNPYILTGDEAQNLLNHISKMSRKFGTKIIIKDNIGVIELTSN